MLAVSTVRAEYKVLFIGNSFTAGDGGTTSVPDIFDALAIAAGQENPTTVKRAVGGTNFEYHYNNSLGQITSQPWTHVILQNFSTEPTHIGNIANHMTYGTLLYDAVMANNPDTQVMLYMTWSRAEAHSYIGSHFASTNEMQNELYTNYHALADALNEANPDKLAVSVNPVGLSWKNAGGFLPSSDPDFIDLYTTDNYHGNSHGYYLSACVHYAAVYRESPLGLFTNPSVSSLSPPISPAEAAFLEQVAWDTVVAEGLIDSHLLIDFGTTGTLTTSGPHRRAWNNVTSDQGSVDATVINGLITTEGTATDIDLTIVSRFNEANSNGTTAIPAYPDSASTDNLYGNTESFNASSDITPVIKLSGLDNQTAYTLTFYASRTGVGDNRQTRYTVTGDRTSVTDLDVHNNTDTTAATEPMFPDTNGEITVAVTPGPNNDNPYHFTYLGVLEVTAHAESALTITSQPQSQDVTEGSTATFSVGVSHSRPMQAQWYRDGMPIPGATGLSFTTNPAGPADNGSLYWVTLTNDLLQVTSDAAALTLADDETPPSLDTLTSSAADTVTLTFSEALAPGPAAAPTNYRIAHQGTLLSATQAVLSSNGREVTLTLATEISGNYVVEASTNLTDLSGNALPAGSFVAVHQPQDNVLFIDFGSASSVTATDAEGNAWNDASGINSTTSGIIPDLTAANGLPSGIGLQMVQRFNSSNSGSGTTESAEFPASATMDTAFGNVGDHGGLTNILPAFRLTNLNPSSTYSLRFFASRLAGDSRETVYTITGASVASASLNPTTTATDTTEIPNVAPNASGEILIELSPGPANGGTQYIYLGILKVTEDRQVPLSLFPMVPLGDFLVLDWTGEGTLETTGSLMETWTPVEPAPKPPYVDTVGGQRSRFYRVRAPAPASP